MEWERTLKQNPSHAECERFAQISLRDDKKGSAIFILPSLFNHSCMANITYTTIGDFMFLYMIRGVLVGEELRVPYLDQKKNFFERKKDLQNWAEPGSGFSCDCLRCVPITSIGKTMAQRKKRI